MTGLLWRNHLHNVEGVEEGVSKDSKDGRVGWESEGGGEEL